MTPEEFADQILDDWLDDGPLVAPRTIAAGLPDRIARQRQRPGWAAGRLPDRRALVTTGAALAAVVVVGLAFTLLVRPPSPEVAAPVVSPAPSDAATEGEVPSEAASPHPGAPINPDRQPCLEGYPGCLGPLAAGSHIATHFRVGFEVPSGWTNAVDTADWLLLGPQDAKPSTWIALLRNAVVSGQDVSCTPDPRPDLGRSVDEIVAYVAGHPGLVTSQPTPVTIGGLAGKRVDVSLERSWERVCPFNGQPTVLYLTQDRADPGFFWVVDPSERQRVAFLDDKAGGVIVVAINAPSAAAFAPLVEAAEPIVRTFSFEHGETPPPATPSPSP